MGKGFGRGVRRRQRLQVVLPARQTGHHVLLRCADLVAHRSPLCPVGPHPVARVRSKVARRGDRAGGQRRASASSSSPTTRRTTLAGGARSVAALVPRRVDHVLVCDDASDDETYRASGWGTQALTDLPLTIVRHPVNLGYGGNQKAGYRWAIEHGLDIVVLLHGDGQYAPEVIEELVRRSRRARRHRVRLAHDDARGGPRRRDAAATSTSGNRILTTIENRLAGLELSASGTAATGPTASTRSPTSRSSATPTGSTSTPRSSSSSARRGSASSRCRSRPTTATRSATSTGCAYAAGRSRRRDPLSTAQARLRIGRARVRIRAVRARGRGRQLAPRPARVALGAAAGDGARRRLLRRDVRRARPRAGTSGHRRRHHEARRGDGPRRRVRRRRPRTRAFPPTSAATSTSSCWPTCSSA